MPANKSHICNECGKHFARPELVTRHARSHLKVKPYVCAEPSCRRQFARSDALLRHTRLLHPGGHTTPLRRRKGNANSVEADRLANSRKPCLRDTSHPVRAYSQMLPIWSESNSLQMGARHAHQLILDSKVSQQSVLATSPVPISSVMSSHPTSPLMSCPPQTTTLTDSALEGQNSDRELMESASTSASTSLVSTPESFVDWAYDSLGYPQPQPQPEMPFDTPENWAQKYSYPYPTVTSLEVQDSQQFDNLLPPEYDVMEAYLGAKFDTMGTPHSQVEHQSWDSALSSPLHSMAYDAHVGAQKPDFSGVSYSDLGLGSLSNTRSMDYVAGGCYQPYEFAANAYPIRAYHTLS